VKFYIAEGNLGEGFSRDQAEKLIRLLKDKGWDVEYGLRRNRATDISEFGREEAIQEAFAEDFMSCLSLLEE